jgi:hypothetical protein
LAAYRDSEILPAVLAKIEHIDHEVAYWNSPEVQFVWIGSPVRAERFAKAADKLRDFATVELLYDGFAKKSDHWRTPYFCTAGRHARCKSNMCGCECHQA